MQNELFVAILAGLGGMLGWGLADFFAKKTIDEIGDIASLAWAHIFGVITLIIFAFYYFNKIGKPFLIPGDSKVLLLLVFFGVFQAIIYILVYKGFGQGQVSVLNPVFSSFSGFTAIFSILIFGEMVTGHVVISLIIVFVGILFINLDLKALKEKSFKISKVPGFKKVALATIFASLWTLFWDKFISGQDWFSYSLFMYLSMTIYIWIVCYARKIKTIFHKPHVWKFLILIGLCETIGYLSISLGYSTTSKTSVVALVSGAFSLPTIILARIFLKERPNRIQTIGTFVIIFGIIILSVLK